MLFKHDLSLRANPRAVRRLFSRPMRSVRERVEPDPDIDLTRWPAQAVGYTPGQKNPLDGLLWGTTERFEPRLGWTNQIGRDERRFAELGGLLGDGGRHGPDSGSHFRPSGAQGERAPPGTVHSASCTAEGFGLESAILKVPGRFFITPRNAEGEAVIASHSDSFTIDITGLERPTHSVTEMADGRLAVRWLPTVSADFKLNLRCNGYHIKGSPFKATAASGSIDASQSEVIDVPETVSVGSTARFRVLARDQMGNSASYPPLSHSANYSFAVRVVCGDVVVPAEVAPLANGTQPVSVNLRTVGEYQIVVTGEDGTSVHGADGQPARIRVLSTPLEARFCRASGPGLQEAHAGIAGKFDIEALDDYGNPCDNFGPHQNTDNFGIKVRLKCTSQMDDFGDAAIAAENKKKAAETSELGGNVALARAGLFNVDYTVVRSGSYELSVSYGGTAILGSPFQLRVVPGNTHPRACVRLHCPDEAAPLHPAGAGGRSSFTLVARDYFHNVRGVGGDDITAGLRSLDGAEKLTCDVEDKGNGSYEISYVPAVAAEYMLSVVLRAEAVLGSPFTLRVLPSPTFGWACIATGYALTLGAVDKRESFMIEARDAHGNPSVWQWSNLRPSLAPACAHPVRCGCRLLPVRGGPAAAACAQPPDPTACAQPPDCLRALSPTLVTGSPTDSAAGTWPPACLRSHPPTRGWCSLTDSAAGLPAPLTRRRSLTDSPPPRPRVAAAASAATGSSARSSGRATAARSTSARCATPTMAGTR